MRTRALPFVCLLAAGVLAAQAPPSATQVTPKVTATTVSAPVALGAGTVRTVTTATTAGNNAYNYFSTFNVAAPDTVDLLLPTGTSNLVNLVDAQALIWGKVNSLLAGGQIGGNVYFADPQGVVLGASGAFNVGALSLVTPTTDFMSGFFDANGNPTAESATLTGSPASVPLSPDGLIAIAGAVNAAGPVNLIAPVVTVAGSVTTGVTTATPAGDPNFDPTLGGMVNTAGLVSGQTITVDGNSITIDGGAAQAQLRAGSGDSSGDVDLNANQVVNLQWVPGLTFFQAPSASAGITIGDAVLIAANINLNAVASTTKLANPPAGAINTQSDGGDFLQNVGYSSTPGDTSLTPLFDNPAFQGLTEVAGVAISKANANISIGQSGASGLYASGNISINASATSNVEVQTIGLYAGVTYGESDANATTAVGAGADLNAGGALSLEAEINNSLLLTTSTASGVKGTATSTPEPAVALAYGKADSESSATVAPGALIYADLVSVEADNANSFESEASGAEYQAATGSSGAGIGIALGNFTSNAIASLSGDVITRGYVPIAPLQTVGGATVNPGDVNVAANSINSTNSIEASSSVSDEMNTGGIFSQLPFTANIAQFASSENPNAEANANALNLAGAVAYAASSNNANATIASGADVNAGWEYGQPGNIAVAALAQDAPDIAATGSAGGGAASIGGSLAYSNFGNTADATIVGQANAATGISVLANASLPNRLNAGPFTALPGQFDNLAFSAPTSAAGFESDWSAIGNLVGDLETALNPNGSDLGEFLNSNGGLNNILTSFVNTGASANGGDNSDGYGVAGSLNFLNINNQASATISGSIDANAALAIEADASASLVNFAGTGAAIGSLKDHNVGVTGDGSLGGAYDGVSLTNSATAAIDDGAQVQAGTISLASNTNEFLVNLAQAGDDSKKFGITGAFDWVRADDTTLAYIESNARVNTTSPLAIDANNTLNDFTIGGALGYGGNAQVGASVAWNQITNTTEAYIGDPGNARSQADGYVHAFSLNLNANSNESLWAISLAATKASGASESNESGTGASDTTEGSEGTSDEGTDASNNEEEAKFGFGASGNVIINDMDDTTEAFINNGAQVGVLGAVALNAADNSWDLAGGLAAALVTGGKDTALAGAFSRNDLQKTTEAIIANAAISGPDYGTAAAESVALTAANTGDVLTIAAGGALAGSGTSLAGSVANNPITNTTEAGLGAGATVATVSDLEISATTNDKVISVAGAASGAGGTGLGAALDWSQFDNTTLAFISDGDTVTAGGNLSLQATTTENLLPIAASLAIGGSGSLSGSAAQEGVDNLTQATIGAATVLTNGNLLLAGSDDTTLQQIVGSAALSGGTGIGLSGAISTSSAPLLQRETDATIAANAAVTAWGNDADPLAFGGQNVVGMELVATNAGSVDSFVAGGALAGDVSVAAELILNYVDDAANATIGGGAQINANDGANAAGDQEVALAASDSTSFLGLTGALSGAGTAAIGAAADTEFLTRNVNAMIGAGANVAAAGNVLVNAVLSGGLTSYAVAGGFGGSLAADGAASLLSLTDTTQAEIDGNVQAGGSVGIAASRNTGINANEGGLSLSLGASLAVAYAQVSTNESVLAAIGAGAQVTALGNSSVPAFNGLFDSQGNWESQPLAGVSVVGISNGSVTDYAVGGAIGGVVGATGSGILNKLTDTTTADIGQGAVVTAPAVNLEAWDATHLTDAAGAAAIGAIGIGAAGDGLPSDPNTLNKTTTAEIDGGQIDTPGALAVQALSSENLTSYAGAAAAGIGGLAGALSNYQIDPTTEALINTCGGCSGPQLSAGSLTLAATDAVAGNLLAGGFAIGAVGFGGALIQGTLDATTSAAFGGGVTLVTPGAVAVNATLNDKLVGSAYAAAGGVIGVGGAESDLNDNSETSASIGADASIQGASSVAMNINSRRELDANALGAAIGAVAGGLSEAIANYRGGTNVSVGNGAHIGSASAPVGSFTFNLFDLANSNPSATALAGGVVSGVGAETEGDSDPRSDTSIGNQAAIFTAGDIDFGAQATSLVDAVVNTEQIGALNAGSAIAEADNDPVALVTIGAADLSAGGKLTVELSALNVAEVNAASAASSSFVSGNYTQAEIYSSPDVYLSVAQGAALTAANQVLLESSANNNADATADGQAGTFNVAAQGSTSATAEMSGSTETQVDGAVASSTGNVTIEALGGGSADANTTGGSGGGLYTGATTSSYSELDPETTAELDSAARITALNGTINFLANGSGGSDTLTYESGDSEIIPTSLVSLLEGDANISADETINANVLGAVLNAATVNLTAQASEFILNASSYVQNGGDGDARALANIQATLRPALTLSGANITGSQAVNLLASSSTSGNPYIQTNTSTTATNSACDLCAGVVHSDSYDSFDDAAIINGSPAPASGDNLAWLMFQGLPSVTSFGHITTPNLSAQVLMPISYSDGVAVWGDEYTDASGSDFTTQDESGLGSADGGYGFDIGVRWLGLQGTVQGAPAAPIALLVAANGSYSGNLPVIGSDPDDLVLGAVSGGAGSLPAVHVTEGGGPGSGADFVSPIDYGGWENILNTGGVQSTQGTGATVTITNDSPLNLIIGAIAAQDVNIDSAASGDVVLNGALYEPQGAVNITDQGGSIYATGAGSIYANQIALNAVQGNLGGTGSLACAACGGSLALGAINTTFFNDGSTPTVALNAGGNLDVNGVVLEDSSATAATGLTLPITVANLTAGGNLYLGLGEGLMDFSGQDYLETSAYTFPNGATAGGTLTLAATGYLYALVRYAFDGTVQSGGNMDIYGSELLQPASLVATGAGSTISAGTLSGDLDLTVQTVGGAVNAVTDGGSVNVTQPSGDLNVGQISAVGCLFGCGYDDVTLTADNGSIDDADNGTVTNVYANNLDLEAHNGAVGGGIFTDANASPLRTQITGSLTANVLFDVNLTQVTGNLNVNSITNETFSTIVDLTALNGSISGGEIGALGSIALAAPQGAIAVADVYSYIGQLSATAAGDITLHADGPIALGNISSQTGDVSVSADGQLAGGGTVSGDNLTLSGSSIGGSEYITTNGPAFTPAVSAPLAIAASGNVTANARGDIALTQVSGNLNLANVTAGGEALLQAPGGAILNAAAPGAAAVTADQIVLNAAAIGASGSPLPVSASGQFDASASGAIDAQSLDTLWLGEAASSAGAVTLTAAAGSILSYTAGPDAADGNLAYTGPATVTAAGTATLLALQGSVGSLPAPLAAAASAVDASAQQSIDLADLSGNLEVGALHAGKGIFLDANAGSILAATPGVNLTASSILLEAYQAIGSPAARLTGSASGIWNAKAGNGIYLTSDGSFSASSLVSPGSNVQLTVNGGGATIGDLETANANLALTQAGAALTVDQASITSLLRASADVQDFGSVSDPSTSLPLYLSLVGANNHVATDIVANTVAAVPVIVETYSSQNGAVTDQGDWLMVEHAGVGQSATFANNWLSLAVTNPTAALQYLTADFVGDQLGMAPGGLAATVLSLLPSQTYTRPATLTAYQAWMVNELSLLP